MNTSDGTGMNDWVQEESFPAKLSIHGGPFQKHVAIQEPQAGSLKAEIACFDDFVVSQLTVTTDRPTSCVCRGNGATVGLFFNLRGSCALTHSRDELLITPGQHTIYFSGDYLERPQLVPEGGQLQVLEINIPVSYYTRLLSGYSTLQDNFLGRIAEGQGGQLLDEMLPITMPMKWIINTIWQNRRTGLLKRLFLEAKTLELLMLQVEQAEIRERELKEWTAKPFEQESLYEAKAILERSLEDPPTIRHLARMVGMNEFSLKKGFKETFHETIYGFVSKAKMQQARQILLDGNRSIREVALMAGYKNPQHFTAAFKKYYGVLPSKVK